MLSFIFTSEFDYYYNYFLLSLIYEYIFFLNRSHSNVESSVRGRIMQLLVVYISIITYFIQKPTSLRDTVNDFCKKKCRIKNVNTYYYYDYRRVYILTNTASRCSIPRYPRPFIIKYDVQRIYCTVIDYQTVRIYFQIYFE